MQRSLTILAYFLIGASSFSQQYPFVHYSPKDGLVSNRVRSVYQDSKGRLYFLTMNGLSIYDGARFTNFTSENGLEDDIVNCVMEMGDDSIWVATNTSKINCFTKGKIKTLSFKSSPTPVVNHLCRNNGNLYAAADEGLFLFRENDFIKLPFTDLHGNDINNYIGSIVPVENYLLCLRDPGLGGPYILYLYDCRLKKVVSQTSNTIVLNIAQSKNGKLWAGTGKGIRQVDKTELLNGKIILNEIPVIFNAIADKIGPIFFDKDDNCWIVDGNQTLIKCDENGNTAIYTSASGLSSLVIDFVFHDKEGITWFASNGGGVDKLMHTNFSVLDKPLVSQNLQTYFFPHPKKTYLFIRTRIKK